MKELLKELATYNCWAHKRVMDVVLTLSPELQVAEIPSSFNSLQKTIIHMWDAESGWWQRMKLQERFVFPSQNFKGTTHDAVNGLLSQSKLWEGWVSTVPAHGLDHVCEYRDRKRESFKIPIYTMLTHVFNHGTFHRGQLINMLRQHGVTKLPSTDFNYWSRTRK